MALMFDDTMDQGAGRFDGVVEAAVVVLPRFDGVRQAV